MRIGGDDSVLGVLNRIKIKIYFNLISDDKI